MIFNPNWACSLHVVMIRGILSSGRVKGEAEMSTKFVRTVFGLAIVAGLALLGEGIAQGQTLRQEGRFEARTSRQAGRANARVFGDFGNRYWVPGGYYYAPGYYYGPGYVAGPSFYRGPGNYAGPGFAGGPGYYAGPAYNNGMAYGPGGYAGGPSAGAQPTAPQRAVLGITMSETPDGVVRVSSVRPNSPADQAGLRPSDVLLAIDGREIFTAQDVTRTVGRHVPGESVRLDVDRDGQNDKVEAVLASPGQFAAGPAAGGPSREPVEPYNELPAPTTPYQVRRAPNATVNPNLNNGFNPY